MTSLPAATTGRKLGLVIDLDICVGCHACVVSCREWNTVGYGAPLDTVVTFTLQPRDDGTRLTLVHSGFVLPGNETAYRSMSGGWPKVVARLGAAAGDGSAAERN